LGKSGRTNDSHSRQCCKYLFGQDCTRVLPSQNCQYVALETLSLPRHFEDERSTFKRSLQSKLITVLGSQSSISSYAWHKSYNIIFQNDIFWYWRDNGSKIKKFVHSAFLVSAAATTTAAAAAAATVAATAAAAAAAVAAAAVGKKYVIVFVINNTVFCFIIYYILYIIYN